MKFKLAFIGFGNVGQGLVNILLEKKPFLKEQYDFEFTVVAVSDFIKGSIYNPNGLDIKKVMDLAKINNISDYSPGEAGWDALKTIKESNADLIIEITYTDVNTGQPATDHIKAALEAKKHVVTTNKGPVILHYQELEELARKNNVQWRYEGTVLSGTPAINLGEKNLAGSGITEIKGIVNGTTNYILTQMEEGMSYEEALNKAQELGYAEADPTGDVEGYDAMGKVVIMTNRLMGANITKKDVNCEGITKISTEDINSAKASGKRWKLIASTKKLEDGTIKAKVSPEMLPLSNPLASVMGATNALTFITEQLGEVTIVGPGAGRKETGFAVLTDILDINRTLN